MDTLLWFPPPPRATAPLRSAEVMEKSFAASALRRLDNDAQQRIHDKDILRLQRLDTFCTRTNAKGNMTVDAQLRLVHFPDKTAILLGKTKDGSWQACPEIFARPTTPDLSGLAAWGAWCTAPMPARYVPLWKPCDDPMPISATHPLAQALRDLLDTQTTPSNDKYRNISPLRPTPDGRWESTRPLPAYQHTAIAALVQRGHLLPQDLLETMGFDGCIFGYPLTLPPSASSAHQRLHACARAAALHADAAAAPQFWAHEKDTP